MKLEHRADAVQLVRNQLSPCPPRPDAVTLRNRRGIVRPNMSPGFEFFFFLTGVLLLVEWALYYAAPKKLARLAFIPVGRPRIARIPQAVLDQGQSEAPYRLTARAPLTVRSLVSSTRIVGKGAVGGWTESYGWLRLQKAWFSRQVMGIARIRVEIRGEQVHLDAKAYPWPVTALFLLPSGLFGKTLEETVGMSFFFAVVIAGTWGMTVWKLGHPVDVALMRIVKDIEGTSPGSGAVNEAVRLAKE